MRSEILAAFPDDVGRYIEVFGGAGWVLFGKDPTRQMEVFNDADGSLINIYRCIKYHPEAVAAELALLPDSREVFFDSAAQTDCRGLTDIQRAARSLYLIKMSFGCDRRTFATAPKIAGNISASFAPVQERLRKVIIEHLDFEQLIRTYDRPNALFYCDPPYIPASATANFTAYGKPFTLDDHRALVAALVAVNRQYATRSVISNSDTPETREIYSAFNLHSLSVRRSVSAKSRDMAGEVIGVLRVCDGCGRAGGR